MFDKDVAIVDINTYIKEKNELTILRQIIIDFYLGSKDYEKIKNEIKLLNDKYEWWC